MKTVPHGSKAALKAATECESAVHVPYQHTTFHYANGKEVLVPFPGQENQHPKLRRQVYVDRAKAAAGPVAGFVAGVATSLTGLW